MRKKVTESGCDEGWIIEAGEAVEAVHDFRKLRNHRFELLQLRVHRGGGFEFQAGGGLVARGGNFAHQRLAARVEEGFDACDFGGVLLVGAALEAGREAHLHFRIDAAGKSGVGIQFLDAAADLEEVERVVGELFGRGARGKRAVIDALRAAQVRGDGDARVAVFQAEASQRRGAEAQAILVSLGENRAQGLVEDESGFEIRAGGRVLDDAQRGRAG